MSAKADILKLHRSDSIAGKVIEITDEYIKYTPENEDLIQIIGSYSVAEIVFDNRKKVNITSKIVIEDAKKDWDNVAIVNDKNAVKGMVKVGEDFKKANSVWSTNTKKGGLEKKVF